MTHQIMRCQTCDYRLWNLKARTCPECGSPFKPSDFKFKPNTVDYCCPHCDHAYIGTDLKGHLDPRHFDCTQCSRPIDIDDMTLRPTEGHTEQQTAIEQNPWLQRKQRGFFKAFFSTVGQSMTSPIQLMRATPHQSSLGQAFWFFAFITILTQTLGSIVSWLFVTATTFAAPGGTFAMLLMLPLSIALMFVYLLTWGLIAHGLLHLTGSTQGTLRRTYQALCYSFGPFALAAIPILSCFTTYIAWVWWAVAATLMLTEAQRVSGKRASFAALTMPVALVLLAITSFVIMMVLVFQSAATVTTAATNIALVRVQSAAQTGDFNRIIASYIINGKPIPHALALINRPQTNATGNTLPFGLQLSSVIASTFIAPDSQTTFADIPVANTDLQTLETLPAARQQKIIAAATAALPPSTIAYRVGDYVFTYPGINSSNARSDLWLVIQSLNPQTNPAIPPSTQIHVGCVSGATFSYSTYTFTTELVKQNALRATLNLPPIPDPSTITPGTPGIKK